MGWGALVHALQAFMTSTAAATGLSLGFGILIVVLAIRLVLIPIMLPLAARTRDRNAIVRTLQPELAALKEQFRKSDPMREQKEVSALHKRHGIGVVDVPGLIGALIQLPILIAMFQAVFHLTRNTLLAAPGILAGIAASLLSVAALYLGGQADSKVMLVLSAGLPVAMSIWLGQGIGL